MSDREVPFDPAETCDICGALGAFDFMGDYYCAECLADLYRVEEDNDE